MEQILKFLFSFNNGLAKKGKKNYENPALEYENTKFIRKRYVINKHKKIKRKTKHRIKYMKNLRFTTHNRIKRYYRSLNIIGTWRKTKSQMRYH